MYFLCLCFLFHLNITDLCSLSLDLKFLKCPIILMLSWTCILSTSLSVEPKTKHRLPLRPRLQCKIFVYLSYTTPLLTYLRMTFASFSPQLIAAPVLFLQCCCLTRYPPCCLCALEDFFAGESYSNPSCWFGARYIFNIARTFWILI